MAKGRFPFNRTSMELKRTTRMCVAARGDGF